MSSRTAATLGFVALFAPALALAEGGLTVVNPAAQYPEGPVVVDGNAYYGEMGADRVMVWTPTGNREVWSRPGCGPTSVARGPEGSLYVLCHIEEALVRISTDGATLSVRNEDDAGRSFPTPNASVNDGVGGVYFSSSGQFSPSAPAEGSVLYLGADGGLRRIVQGFRYANGVAISADGKTLFVSEHFERRVIALDIAAPGDVSAAHVFLKLDDVVPQDPGRSWEVGPDGLATDTDGNLYVAEYGGGRLVIVDRNAKHIATIDFPEKFTTAPALLDGGRRIFMTAPVSFADPKAAGKVYVVDNPAFTAD